MTEIESSALRTDQVQRYSRQLILPDVGSEGQRKLLRSKVLVIGAGGLGSPVALYLACSGVGTIGIVDYDTVDISNLHRQILHTNDEIGERKVDSAEANLKAHNPDVNVIKHTDPISSDNALEIMQPYEVIVNGSDNFPTRYLVNDAAYLLKKPLVDGGILTFAGIVTTYIPGEGCYRCIYPEPPQPGTVPSCAEAGVIGPMCGLVGSIQATETLKIILGKGRILSDRLISIDGLDMEFREFKRRRQLDCALCGENPSITELIDYENFCGAPTTALG